MKLVARAKTPGQCCLKECYSTARLIYEGNNYRMLACCEEHAGVVYSIIESIAVENEITIDQLNEILKQNGRMK